MALFETTGIARLLVTLILATIIVYFAAKWTIDATSLARAFLTVVIATVVSGFVAGLINGILGELLSLIVWAAMAALVYRTAWIKGAIIGIVAWVLWLVVGIVVGAAF